MLTRKIYKPIAATVMMLWPLFASDAANAQQQASSTSKNAATVEAARSRATRISTAESEESRGGPKEGINVHGHWKIVVKNPDGDVASQSEFENALLPEGAKVLASVLTQAQSTVPAWTVNLIGQTSGFGAAASVQAMNGTVVLTASRQSPFSVQLTITRVSTSVSLGAIGLGLTSRDLTQPVPPSTTAPGPITLQAGQTVDVTVVLSFS